MNFQVTWNYTHPKKKLRIKFVDPLSLLIGVCIKAEPSCFEKTVLYNPNCFIKQFVKRITDLNQTEQKK